MNELSRRDWDYVEFADYQSDMRETTERATAIISGLRQERDAAENLVLALVHAAGGEVRVCERDIAKDGLRNIELVKEYDARHMAWVFRSIRTAETTPPNDQP
jgi:hypothetical protein